MYSSTLSAASKGPPAAIWPTSGSMSSSRDGRADAGRSRPTSSSARGFVRVAAQQAGPLRDWRDAHRRRRSEPDGVSDLAHGGRIPVRIDVIDDEIPDLLLPGGQHR